MAKHLSIINKLQQYIDNKEFSALEPYRDPMLWKSMSRDEKELLGVLFVMHGKDLLEKEDGEALRSFDLAAKLAPKNAKILYHKGVAYSTQQNQNLTYLTAACRAFEKATKLDPQFFEAWFRWGHALLIIGESKKNIEKLQQANEKFAIAEPLIEVDNKEDRAAFCWLSGQCWATISRLSGEAIEMSKALKSFKRAAELELDLAEFWNDYGNALATQATLLGRLELFQDVIELFRNAVKSAPEKYEGWLNLACSFVHVYRWNPADEYFELANEAFSEAARIYDKDVNLWISWGQLLLQSGKLQHDLDLIEASCEKFDCGEKCDSEYPLLYCRWGEALACLGAKNEDYNLLKDAEEKFQISLQLDPKNPETLYFYGRCFVEFARYFNDSSYYLQAIQKYQYALTLGELFEPLYYGIAMAYYELAELTADPMHLKESIKFFDVLNKLVDNLPPQFWLDWANALMRYGEVTQQRQQIESSIEKYEHALELFQDAADDEPLILETLYHYGCALDCLGDFYEDPSYYEKAIQLFISILHVEPSFSNARYNLALALVHVGELMSDIQCLEKANEQFELLIAEDQEDQLTWNDWGVALLHLGQLMVDPSQQEMSEKYFVEAEAKLMHAVALGNVSSFYNLACHHSLTRNYPEAMRFLERALKANSLPAIDDIMHDEWLADLRNTAEFRTFISKLIDPQDL